MASSSSSWVTGLLFILPLQPLHFFFKVTNKFLVLLNAKYIIFSQCFGVCLFFANVARVLKFWIIVEVEVAVHYTEPLCHTCWHVSARAKFGCIKKCRHCNAQLG